MICLPIFFYLGKISRFLIKLYQNMLIVVLCHPRVLPVVTLSEDWKTGIQEYLAWIPARACPHRGRE